MRQTPDKAIKYIRNLFAPEDSVLKTAKQAGFDRGVGGMQVGAEEGKLLQTLVALSGAKKIVEIGTFMGYSTIWMARALPEDGYLYAIEKNADCARQASEHITASDVADRVSVKQGDALEILQTLESEGPFDMVFIDADKGGYVKYLDWAEQNIRKGGLIVGDNTFLFGDVYEDECPQGTPKGRWQTMREFNQRLADPTKYQSILIPTAEGMTVAVKLF